ncbi:MAG: GNAT family N-acetyltransferase [Treponema sp.]|nr:GNAT family N-acetyltransferase [Treponema sp.]MEE3435577.1 GNAT family N-acetyltransferase [Treponema sp.]
MEIRELNEGDLESLVKLYEQLDGSNEGFTAEAARLVWKSEIEGNKNIKYFGAIEDGKVVSTCFCLIIPNLTRLGSSACFVENVVTDKNHRGQGLGKKIMERAIAFARERGCYKVILESASFRKEAHQFYKNLGFDGDSKKAFIMKLKKY